MQHLAIIPDGNRRWAAKNKLESLFGHKKGMDAVKKAVKVCIKNSIRYLSFYTFSLENFQRSSLEKSYLFNLINTSFQDYLPELIEQKIRVKFLGDRTLFPDSIKETITKIEEKTKEHTTLQLNLLFCYGAQQEIINATKKLAQQARDNKIDIKNITSETIKNNLWTSGIPDPELVIRTGKTIRISNFLLFQAAYAEFEFLDIFWPEMTESILEKSIKKFCTVKRNFGT